MSNRKKLHVGIVIYGDRDQTSGGYLYDRMLVSYLESQGEGHRDICLIPSSAHGTNPASAAMANMRVVIVACDEQGNVDIADLKARILASGLSIGQLVSTAWASASTPTAPRPTVA